MSWQVEMTSIVRHIINDVPAPQTYNDGRLQDTILISAQLIREEVDWEKTYTIDIPNSGLTPDPTTVDRDDGFVNLVSLKAACTILRAAAQAQAGNAIKVVDGPSQVDMTGAYKAAKDHADTVCDQYQQAKIQYQAGNSRAGQAILGPYVVQNTPPKTGNF